MPDVYLVPDDVLHTHSHFTDFARPAEKYARTAEAVVVVDSLPTECFPPPVIRQGETMRGDGWP